MSAMKPLSTKERLSMAYFWADTRTPRMVSFALFGSMLAIAGTATAELPEPHHKDGRIGYVLTERHWAMYGTPERSECPDGINARGTRDMVAEKLSGESDVERTVVNTRLRIEGFQFHNETGLADIYDSLPFYEAQGPVSYGLNLDGEIGPDSFQSPGGEQGIDNQLYRALGCTEGYRKDGPYWFFENNFMHNNGYNRWMIEISGVDDLVNDDDVTVTTYRGLDSLSTDATGEGFVAGGTQRVDMRWGQGFIEQVKGRIVDGVLITEPFEHARIPWSQGGVAGGYHILRDLRLQLNLTPQKAEGLLGGYVDVDQFNHRFRTTWSTHHQNYGQSASGSEYAALRRLADAHPDPETGANTAISSAVEVTMTQVYVLHPESTGQ